MRSASRDVHEQMMLVGELVERVSVLPAVPTGDWCQQAAAVALPLGGDGPVAVGLAVYDQAGEAIELEDAGAATRDGASSLTLRGLLEPEAAGWSLPAADGLDASNEERLMRTVELAGLSGGAREAWAPFPTETLLVSSVAIDGRRPRRRLTLIASADSASSGLASIMAAVMPSMVRRASLAFGTADGSGRGPSRLTAREVEVLDRLLLGMSIKKIAESLGRSPHTVHDHVKSLHAKLGASSRGELVARALGHIDPRARKREARRETPTGSGDSEPADAGGAMEPVVRAVTLAGLKL